MLVLVTLLLLLLRFGVLRQPSVGGVSGEELTADGVVDALLAASAAALGIGALLSFLFRSEETPESFRLVTAGEIEKLLRDNAWDSTEWLLRSRTGNYFRVRTLQWLEDAARERNVSPRIRLQLLDPSDDNVRRSYAKYRGRRTPDDSAQLTEDELRREILATILACILAKARVPRLEFEVGLNQSAWVTSFDISAKCAIVTTPNRGDPAIYARADTSLYRGYRDDFESGFLHCSTFTLPYQDSVLTASPADVRRAFVSASLPAHHLDDLSDDAVMNILHRANTKHHHYE